MADTPDAFGYLATIMIASQYMGIAIVAGAILLLSLLLPWKGFFKVRAALGVVCLLIAGGIYAWLASGGGA